MEINQFDHLDAQNEMSRFAQMTSEEHADYQAYLDAQHEIAVAAQDADNANRDK